MKQKYIIANWKMNASREFISYYSISNKLISSEKYKIIIAPPFSYLSHTRRSFDASISIASQDISHEKNGPHTGQVSAIMLKDLACEYAIIGHNETREYTISTKEILQNKIQRMMEQDLKVIYCIGEKDKSDKNNAIINQLNEISFDGIKEDNFIIAYEPIWAIGTNKTPSIEEISNTINFIKDYLSVQKNVSKISIIYGGSVNETNAKNILDVTDGVIIGNKSLEMNFINNIIK